MITEPLSKCQCPFPLYHIDKHLYPDDCGVNIKWNNKDYINWPADTYAYGEPKPVLRGVLHEIIFLLLPIYIVSLLNACNTTTAYIAATIKIISKLFLYGVSSQFHRRNLSRKAYTFLKRLDHCGIFITTAGTATPVSFLLMQNAYTHMVGVNALIIVWTIATLGCTYTMVKDIHGKLNLFGLGLMILSGGVYAPLLNHIYLVLYGYEMCYLILMWACYVFGIYIYHNNLFDIYPHIFGYHEMFHIVVTMGSISSMIVNYSIISRL